MDIPEDAVTGTRVEQIGTDDPRWPDLVRRFDGANIFHSPEMAAVLQASPRFRVYPLLAVEGVSRQGAIAYLESGELPEKYHHTPDFLK